MSSKSGEKFIAWGKKRFPPKSWMSEAAVIVKKAEGSCLTTLDGKKIIDFTSQWQSNNVGNVHPEVLEASVDALKRYGFLIPALGMVPEAYELAEKLVEISPGKRFSRVTYEVSGTEAVEAGVSYSLAYKDRPLIISFIKQYHGMSLGAKNIGSLSSDIRRFNETFQGGVLFAPYPLTYGVPFKESPEEYADFCLWYIEDHILKYISRPDRIAGILFEPIIGEGGCWIPPDNFIPGLKKLADEYDWALICDEVLVGFGRTGKMWSIEHWNIDTDLMPIGKALSGGLMPLAGCMGTEEAMGGTEAYSCSTFGGHPASYAAALKNIEIIEREKLCDRAARLGEEALKRMKEWVGEYEIVGDARGKGLMLAIDMIKAKKKPGMFPENVEVAEKTYYQSIEEEVLPLWGTGDTHLRIVPPLNIPKELLDQGLAKMEEAIKKIQKSL